MKQEKQNQNPSHSPRPAIPPPPRSLSKNKVINFPLSPRQSPRAASLCRHPRPATVPVPAVRGLRYSPGTMGRRRRRKGSSPAALVIGTAVMVLLSEAAGTEPTARSPSAGFSLGVCRSVQIRGLTVFLNNFHDTVNQSCRQASRPGA